MLSQRQIQVQVFHYDSTWLNKMTNTLIRFATVNDCPSIYNLILELAIFEKAEDQVQITIEQLEKDGFGEKPLFECLVAEMDGKILGFTLFFTTYSTWKGPCLYLEDFAVLSEARRSGIGKALFDKLLTIAKERKVGRFAWQVLDWNTSAIDFYKNYKTEFDEEWVNCRIHFD